MAAGIIPYTNIPGWPTVADGLAVACENALIAAGFPAVVSFSPDGVNVSDVTTVNAVLSSYVGSPAQLNFVKAQKQTALDAVFDSNFDLAKFIRGGFATNITASNVGTFLAIITNNYRSLRAQIANALTVSVVAAINVNSGWPSNP